MSSPTVYLAPGMSGKLLFSKVCVYNGHKVLHLKKNLSIEFNIPKGFKCREYEKIILFNIDGTLKTFGPYQHNIHPNIDYTMNGNNPIKAYYLDQSIDKEIPKNNHYGFEHSKIKSIGLDLVSSIVKENFNKYSKHIFHLDGYSIFDRVDYSNSRILFPYRKIGIERTLIHSLFEEDTPFISYKEAEYCLNKFLHGIELAINKLKENKLSYEFLDISDKDVYKNIGLDSEEFRYNKELSTFEYGDPKLENISSNHFRAKTCIKFARKYVDRNKKYLTSLFPDIVV